MRDCVKSRSCISIIDRLRTYERPPGSMLPAALCALAAASCAPAYTKPNFVSPPDMHTTGTVRPARSAPPIKQAVALPKISSPSPNIPNSNVPSPNVAGPNVAMPSQALLKPQPEPDCTFPATDTAADERQKLDYERQCYRHAEMIARARLQLLQESVAKTPAAVKSGI
jgi:hypothetical protein